MIIERESILTLDLTAFIRSSTFGHTSPAPNFVATQRKESGAEHKLSTPGHHYEKLKGLFSTASAGIVRPERCASGRRRRGALPAVPGHRQIWTHKFQRRQLPTST